MMKTIRLRGRAVMLLGVCSIFSILLLAKSVIHLSGSSSSSQPKELLPRSLAPQPFTKLNEDVDKFKPIRVPDAQPERKPRLIPGTLPPVKKKVLEMDPPELNGPPGELKPEEKDKRVISGLKPRKRTTKPPVGYPVLKRGKFIPGHRVVHLDLKGAAPKVPYFRQVFQFIKTLGATGVLLEWEDMFPYTGTLSVTRHNYAYSVSEIRQILDFAKEAQLDIIPLVQTFGHLEWILKHDKFAHLRQVDRYPQVICLSDPEAVSLVKEALDQVLAIHKEYAMPFFHMGADEAFQVGMCQKDQAAMQKDMDNSRERLMLKHIATIAKHIIKKIPDTKVLMWHDMLNNVENSMMQEYKLGELVEPVVWNYAENLEDQLYPDMWARFGQVFPNIWGASAYKGADGPSRFYSNIPHYLQNHQSWIDQMTNNYKSFKQFRGIILTGWQRFDHFAVLCEIIPVGLPSAAVNLMTLERGQYDRSMLTQVSKLMDCASTIDIEAIGVAGYCNFPGFKIYQQVQQLRMVVTGVEQNVFADYQVHGWLSEFNIRHNYSNAWYLDQIMEKLQMGIADLEAVAQSLRAEMSVIFFGDTIDEFIFEYVEPHLNKLKEMENAAKRIGAIRSFPGRPFRIQGKLSQWSQSAEADKKSRRLPANKESKPGNSAL